MKCEVRTACGRCERTARRRYIVPPHGILETCGECGDKIDERAPICRRMDQVATDNAAPIAANRPALPLRP